MPQDTDDLNSTNSVMNQGIKGTEVLQEIHNTLQLLARAGSCLLSHLSHSHTEVMQRLLLRASFMLNYFPLSQHSR